MVSVERVEHYSLVPNRYVVQPLPRGELTLAGRSPRAAADIVLHGPRPLGVRVFLIWQATLNADYRGNASRGSE
jgi:hypothetical protein